MSRLYHFMGVDMPFDPEYRFETSWLLPPWALCTLRSLFAFYAFFVLFFQLGYESTHDNAISARRSFSFFTNLTYWGLAFYFLFSAMHTLTYSKTGKPLLSTWPRPLQALHSLFYSSIITYPFLVTIVFWGAIYSGPWFPVTEVAWTNISQHALNSSFALFELLIPRTLPLPALHLLLLIILLALYLGLAYLTHATQGWYPYSFLDPNKGHQVAYIFGILAAVIVVFLVAALLVWGRKVVTERVLGMRGKLRKGLLS